MNQSVEPRVEECAICCEFVNRVKVLPCDHPICWKCLKMITAGKKITVCPQCRYPVDTKSFDHIPWRYFGQVTCEFCLQLKETDDIWYCTVCTISICSKCVLIEHTHSKEKEEKHRMILWVSPNFVKELQNKLLEASAPPSPQIKKKLSKYFEKVQSELLHMIEEREKEYKKSVLDGLVSLYGTGSTPAPFAKYSDLPYNWVQKTIHVALKPIQLAGTFENDSTCSEFAGLNVSPKELAASLIPQPLYKKTSDKPKETAVKSKLNSQSSQSNIGVNEEPRMSKQTRPRATSLTLKQNPPASKKDAVKSDGSKSSIESGLFKALVESGGTDKLPWRYYGKVACDLCQQLMVMDNMWYCTACSVSICNKCALTEHTQQKDKQHKLVIWPSPDLIKELQSGSLEVSTLPSQLIEKKLSEYFERVQSELLHVIEERRKEYKRSICDGLVHLYCTESTPVASATHNDMTDDVEEKTVRSALKAMQLAGAPTSVFEIDHMFSEIDGLTVNPKELAASLMPEFLFKNSSNSSRFHGERAAESQLNLQLQQFNITKPVEHSVPKKSMRRLSKDAELSLPKETELSVPKSRARASSLTLKRDLTVSTRTH